jgi:hypothetical protein
MIQAEITSTCSAFETSLDSNIVFGFPFASTSNWPYKLRLIIYSVIFLWMTHSVGYLDALFCACLISKKIKEIFQGFNKYGK